MIELESLFVDKGAHANGKERGTKGGDRRLYLHQRDISHNHLEHLPRGLHVAHVGLRREAGGQAHIKVALESQEARHQNKELSHMHEYFPVLYGGAGDE